jgi:hypothetical protein
MSQINILTENKRNEPFFNTIHGFNNDLQQATEVIQPGQSSYNDVNVIRNYNNDFFTTSDNVLPVLTLMTSFAIDGHFAKISNNVLR